MWKLKIDSKARVLVIEDELPIVELLKYNLSKANYDVDYCTDGEYALDKIFSVPSYDLILIDWMLPELSGIEICRRIRKNKSTRKKSNRIHAGDVPAS